MWTFFIMVILIVFVWFFLFLDLSPYGYDLSHYGHLWTFLPMAIVFLTAQ